MEVWKSVFSIWNECFFACKSYNSKRINRAVLDKILVEIKDKTIRNGRLKFNF